MLEIIDLHATVGGKEILKGFTLTLAPGQVPLHGKRQATLNLNYAVFTKSPSPTAMP